MSELVESTARLQLVGAPLSKVASGASCRCLLDDSKEERAAKLLPLSALENKRDDMLAEIRLCQELRHASIVRLTSSPSASPWRACATWPSSWSMCPSRWRT